MRAFLELKATELAGWICKAPSPQADEIDGDVVSNSPCERCGRRRIYWPYILRGDYGRVIRYRAFAVCEKCDEIEEF